MKIKTLSALLLLLAFISVAHADSSAIGSISLPQTISVVSQTYVDSYFTWTFTQIDAKNWNASFVINPTFWSNATSCAGLSGNAQTKCYSNLCNGFSSNGTFSINTIFNCGAANVTKLQNDLLNMSNYPVKTTFTGNMTFSPVTVNVTKGTGTFVINFPNGFQPGLVAELGFGSTLINTTTFNNAIGSVIGPARQTFFVNGRFWVFYGDGTNFVYTSSTSGTSGWNITCIAIPNIWARNTTSVTTNGTHVFIVTSGYDVKNPMLFRAGTLGSDGSITWLAATQTVLAATTTHGYLYPSIAVNSTGNAYIGFRYDGGTSNITADVIANANSDGTWSTSSAGLVQLNTTGTGNWLVAVVSLGGGKIGALYAQLGNSTRGKYFNGVAWSTENQTSYIAYTMSRSASWYMSATPEGANFHFVFLNATTNKIIYGLFNTTTNSFQNLTVLTTATLTTTPQITMNGTKNNNNVVVFYAGLPVNKINSIARVNGVWGTNITAVTDVYTITGNDRLMVADRNYTAQNDVGFVFMNATSSPYTIKFATYTMNTPNYIISVAWNSPTTNTWNTSRAITHGYTPSFYDSIFINCSLYSNETTGTWGIKNTTTSVTNNTINYMLYNYAADQTLAYTYIECCNSSNTCNATANATIKIDTVAPSAVSALTNNTQNSAWVNLTWTAATDATSGVALYVIYQNGTYKGNTTTAINRYNATGLTEYSTYIFNVSAFDNAGNYGPNLSVIVLTNDVTAPGAPGSLLNASENSAWIYLTWTASTETGSGVKTYLVYRNQTNIANTTNLNYNDTGVSEYSLYAYNVSALDNYGNWGANSSTLSALTKDVTAPGAPGSLTNASQADTWIYLTWSASTETGSGILTYLIYRNLVNIINTTNTYYNNTGLTASTAYAFNVSALDNYGNWGPNSTVTTTTYATSALNLAFVITIPRGGTNYTSANASTGNQTLSMYFNGTTSNDKMIQPCSVIDLTGCQTAATPIVRFWNIGSVAEQFDMVINSTGTTWSMQGNTNYNATPFVFASGATKWIVNLSVTNTGNNFVDAWLYINLTAFQGGTPTTAMVNYSTASG